MTKAELLKALEPFRDDQYIGCLLHDQHGTRGQIFIQAITPYPPWHNAAEDQSNWLIGIEIHHSNKILYPADEDKRMTELTKRWNEKYPRPTSSDKPI